MPSLSLDIFKKDVHGNLICLDAVGGLDAARLRLSQLASVIIWRILRFDQKHLPNRCKRRSLRFGPNERLQ
jgi:hypothetical protein